MHIPEGHQKVGMYQLENNYNDFTALIWNSTWNFVWVFEHKLCF